MLQTVIPQAGVVQFNSMCICLYFLNFAWARWSPQFWNCLKSVPAVRRTSTSSAWGRRETKGGQQAGAHWGPVAPTPIGGRCSSRSRIHHIPHIPRLFKPTTFLLFTLLIRSNCAFIACQFHSNLNPCCSFLWLLVRRVMGNLFIFLFNEVVVHKEDYVFKFGAIAKCNVLFSRC